MRQLNRQIYGVKNFECWCFFCLELIPAKELSTIKHDTQGILNSIPFSSDPVALSAVPCA